MNTYHSEIFFLDLFPFDGLRSISIANWCTLKFCTISSITWGSSYNYPPPSAVATLLLGNKAETSDNGGSEGELLDPHQTWSLPQLPPNKNCCKETAIKFSWLPLQRTASISPRRWMDMSNATKVDEQAVSTVRLTPSSPRQKEIRFAAILALDGNGKKVVSTFAFLLLHC